MRQSRPRVSYTCRECGQRRSRWEGRCSQCGAWNALEETEAPAAARSARRKRPGPPAEPLELASLPAEPAARLSFGIAELDRVLGGGLAPGSVTLLAGDPGVGKSTLLLQAASAVADRGLRALYVTGEESVEQLRMRAARLGVGGTRLYILASNDLDEALERIESLQPAIVAVDSIQTAVTSASDSAQGSVNQIHACTQLLTAHAKARGAPVILAGHVTKDGSIAGPRVLEHIVDVVLHLVGEAGGPVRLLHGVKNRFGPTNEVGVFEMRGDGLAEVRDPSRVFLAQRAAGTPGSAVATVLEGTRPLSVEVQALTSPSALPSPRRVATGFDLSRLHVLIAVLARRLGLGLAGQDVIVNVPGGLRLREPAADLAAALAIASSLLDAPVDPDLSAAAEIGLGGELRPVTQAARRAAEARRLGFGGCLLARPCDASIADDEESAGGRHVSTLAEAVRTALPRYHAQNGARAKGTSGADGA